jgi:two-component system cell cycle response regulator DivK
MRTILLVEDNEMSRDMLTRRLGRHGYEIIVALDGKSAIETAHSVAPDLVLMDLRLPDINGKEVTRQLKSDPATAHIPVLALTAHAMESDRAEALRIGCDDFETKPVDLPRLLAKISALLQRHIRSQDGHDGLQFPLK